MNGREKNGGEKEMPGKRGLVELDSDKTNIQYAKMRKGHKVYSRPNK